MKKKYIYVYQTICQLNGKSYIGVHATNNIDDGYIGGGIRGVSSIAKNPSAKKNTIFHNAVRKYGYIYFKRYILSFFDTLEEAFDEERYLVNKEWVKSKGNYNCALGGKGCTIYWMTDTQKKERIDKHKGERHHSFGKTPVNARRVIQYDLKNNILVSYNSATEAANILDVHNSNITSCCLGKYGQCGGFIFRYETYTEDQYKKLQYNLTKRHREYNSNGTWKMSDEVKTKLKGRVGARLGYVNSEETRRKISVSNTGKKSPHSELTKQKIGNANRGRIFSADIKKIFSDAQTKYKKIVIQYDKQGNEIAVYESVREAARAGKFDRSAIKRIIEGRSKSHKGFTFKFKEDLAA